MWGVSAAGGKAEGISREDGEDGELAVLPENTAAALLKRRQQITPLAPRTINSSASFLALIQPIIGDFNNNDS